MSRYALVAIVVAAALLLLVLELIRSRRLQERYAMLWLVTAIALLVVSLWEDGLGLIADAVGIRYAPSALFAVVIAFVLAVLLQYSVAVSRLSEQNTRLAQRIAQLEEAQRAPPPEPDA